MNENISKMVAREASLEVLFLFNFYFFYRQLTAKQNNYQVQHLNFKIQPLD